MQAGDQMQQRGFTATGGADDADELSGTHLKINVVESEQALSALGVVARADLAQADLGRLLRNRGRGAANRDWPQLAVRTTRSTASEDRKQGRRELETGWGTFERSYSLDCLSSLFREDLVEE